MKSILTVFTAFLFLGSAAPAFPGGTALSQLPGSDQVLAQPPAPVIAPGTKSATTRLDFRISQYNQSGFTLNDYSQGVQVNGYRDFDGNFRFTGQVAQASFLGGLTRNYNSQDFSYEMDATMLQVRRYAIHYKVTGFAGGANGTMTPVNLLIRGGIRDRRYSVSEAGLELQSSADGITGTVDATLYDKHFVASIAAIMASLRSDAVLGVLEEAGNFPNPFLQGNGTTLTYTLLQPADSVRITVYNAYGKVLHETDGGAMKGVNNVFWDGHSNYNDNITGQRILIWQLEIYFRGETEKVIKQFTMNAR